MQQSPVPVAIPQSQSNDAVGNYNMTGLRREQFAVPPPPHYFNMSPTPYPYIMYPPPHYFQPSYYPYPPECIIYYQIYKYKANFNDFINTQFDESINSYGEKRYDAYISLISNEQINEALNNVTAKLITVANNIANNVANNKEDIKETSYENELYTFMTKYANRLDVYSVGMLIVTVYLYIDYSGVSKNIKDEFKTFIKQLIEPDVFKRVSPLEAYANFKKLYSKL
jgi:hypothetical protein